MGTPKGNGLVEITGENKTMDNGWFCIDLMGFLRGADWDIFHYAFQQAKSGNCPFREECKRYERTVKKRGDDYINSNKQVVRSLFENES